MKSIRKSDNRVKGRGAPGPDAVQEAARQWEERYEGADGFRALTSLVRAYGIVVRGVDAHLRPLGLTLSRFELLLLLSFTRAGGLPMMRIRDLLIVHGSSVTYLVDRLEEAGWVAREPDPADRRVSLVRITDAGREVVERGAELLARAGFGALAALDRRRLEELSALLDDLRQERPPAPAVDPGAG